MASFGLAAAKGRQIYQQLTREEEEFNEFMKNAPLRDLQRKKQMDEIQDYFSESNKAVRAEEAALKMDTARKSSVLRKYRDDIIRDESGTAYANFVNEAAPVAGAKWVSADPDGYKNGLTLSLVDSSGNVLDTKVFNEIKSADDALRLTSQFIRSPLEQAKYLEGVKAAEVAHANKIKEIDAGKEWDLKAAKVSADASERNSQRSAAATIKAAGIAADARTSEALITSLQKDTSTNLSRMSALSVGFGGVDANGSPLIYDQATNTARLPDMNNPVERAMLEQYVDAYKAASMAAGDIMRETKGVPTPGLVLQAGQAVIEAKAAKRAQTAAAVGTAAERAAQAAQFGNYGSNFANFKAEPEAPTGAYYMPAGNQGALW